MATTPDERQETTRTQRVVEATKKVVSNNSGRFLTALAAGLCVGVDRPTVAVGLGLLIYVIGGKK
jgi:hypothetical protein